MARQMAREVVGRFCAIMTHEPNRPSVTDDSSVFICDTSLTARIRSTFTFSSSTGTYRDDHWFHWLEVTLAVFVPTIESTPGLPSLIFRTFHQAISIHYRIPAIHAWVGDRHTSLPTACTISQPRDWIDILPTASCSGTCKSLDLASSVALTMNIMHW